MTGAYQPNNTGGDNSSLRFGRVDWKDDGQVNSFLDKLVNDKQQYMRAWESRANMNIAWYRGFQNLFWDIETRQFVTVGNPRRRVRAVINKIKPAIDQKLAFQTAEPIDPDVSPATEDSDDYERARLSTQLLRYYYDQLNGNWKDERVNKWSLTTGVGYLATTWDDEAGGDFDAAKKLGMEPDEFKRVYETDPEMQIGDLRWEVIPSTSVFWGPYGSEWEDKEWVLLTTERSREYVEQRYDIDGNELSSEETVNRQIWRQSDLTTAGIQAKHNADGNALILKEFYARKCKKYPNGVHAVVCSGKVLNRKYNKTLKNPYENGEIPVHQMVQDFVPNDPLAMSDVDQLIGPQASYNRRESQQIENCETMAQPGFMAQQGTIPNPDLWTGEAGNIKYFNGQAPQQIPGLPMPNSVLQQMNRQELAIQDLTGIHDVSTAKVPTGAKSGRSILALQEKDESRNKPIRLRRRRFWEDVFRFSLCILKQYANEERLAKILGEDNRWEVIRWKGDQLVGAHEGPGIDYYDVRIKTTGLPTGRIAQGEVLSMLINSGALKPGENQKHSDLLFRVLEIGDLESQVDPAHRDKMRAREENELLALGSDVPIQESDDDAVHMAEHLYEMKSSRVRALPPEIQDNFDRHVKKHKYATAFKALEPQLIVQTVMQQTGLIPPAAPVPPGGSQQPSGGRMGASNVPNGQKPRQMTFGEGVPLRNPQTG